MKRNMMFFLYTVLLHLTVASALEVELIRHEEIAIVNGGASLRAECPAGKYVVGGGFNRSTPKIGISASFPSSDLKAWSVSYSSVSSSPITVFAVCVAPLPGLELLTASTQTVSGTHDITADCPTGKYAIGGGWGDYGQIENAYQNVANNNIYQSSTAGDLSAWRVTYGTVQQIGITVYAICADILDGLEVAVSEPGHVDALCSPDKVALSGGFLRDGAKYFNGSSPSVPEYSLKGWTSSANGAFTTYAICASRYPTAAMMQYKDVNGDGRADALYFDTVRTKQVWVSVSTGSGFTTPQPWVQHGDSTPGMMQYADVNGDGKADALYFDTARSRCVWVSLSTGTGFTVPQPWVCHGDSTPDMMQYKDVNGDGKADALYFDTLHTKQVWVSLSTGSGFATPQPWAKPVTNP